MKKEINHGISTSDPSKEKNIYHQPTVLIYSFGGNKASYLSYLLGS